MNSLKEAEKKYEKWQLLATPVTLDSFNSMPLLNSMFFEHALKLSSDLEMPILAQDSVDVKIKAWEVIRYKYKFFLKDKVNITSISFTFLLSNSIFLAQTSAHY